LEGIPHFQTRPTGVVPKNLQIIASPKKRRQQQQQPQQPCLAVLGRKVRTKKNNDHKKSLAYRTVHEMQKR
jgi:hypothetical protein